MNDVFIQILGDYLNNIKNNYQIDDELLYLAKIHQVEAIVYSQTHNSSFKAAFYYSVYIYNLRKNLLNEISCSFKANNIEYFFVKGTEISRLYPNPFLRTMGDSDIIVHEWEKNKAADLLISMGFEENPRNRLSGSEWVFSKNGLIIELHHALLYGSSRTEETENDEYLTYFSKCWDYVMDGKLDDDFHLLYLIIHLRKHFMNNGVGIRQFMDLAIYSTLDLDWNWIKKQLESLKLLSFSNHVYGLIYRWWGIKTPLEMEIYDDFYISGTDIILNSGAFGMSDCGIERHEINQIRHGENKMTIYLKRLFPSYEYLIQAQCYNGLIGKRYLLPVFWIYRILFFIKRRGNIRDQFVNDKSIENRKRVFKEWGLEE